MQNVSKMLGLAIVAILFSACGAMQDSHAISSDWEVMELLYGSNQFDTQTTEFEKCISTNTGKAQEKCDEIIKNINDLCQKGEQKYCVIQARFYRTMDSNYLKGVEIFKKSCDSGYGHACGWLGIYYWRDYEYFDMKADSKKGLSYLQKSCDLGSSVGCGNLANVYYGDDEFAKSGILRDIVKAKLYINKAIKIANRDCQSKEKFDGQKYACESLEQLENLKSQIENYKE